MSRLARWVAALAVFCGLTLLPATALAADNNVTSITIDDTAGILNHDKIRDVMATIEFNQPTKVAFYTREGEYSDNINTETLFRARSHHPEWISADPEDYGDYWADNYFIITLSVESDGHGQIGTYFGEDRKVSDSLMESIHEAGYPDFRQARWTDGVLAVAQRGSEVMNRPWYQQPAVWWTGGIGGAIAAATAGTVAAVRSKRRTSFAEELAAGRRHLANVSTDLDATEISARTLPSGSRHADELERRFADFITRYRKAFTDQQELEAAEKKVRSSSGGVARSKAFREVAEELDFTDDAILQAAALYTRSATWQDAWRAQTAPLLADLDEIDSLTSDATDSTQGAASALRSFAAEARTAVDKISADLQAQTIEVDAALDGLADLRKKLTERLDAFATAQIDAFAKSESEKQKMRDKMREARYEYSSRQRRRGTGSILDVTLPGDLFWRVQSYSAGYQAGRSSVQSDRNAASRSSSGGISHGYSGGGGSFSGSGGSSRF